MSSKFFTWTKGDRRNTVDAYRGAGGLVPIEGLESARSAKGSNKASNRPAPLPLLGSSESKSKYNSRTHDSLALHDAAVQSATSLMTLMSDMLHSPQLSAHMSAQSRSAGLISTHGPRSRSHTAPPTPLLQNTMMPVELPGSLPGDRKSDLPFRPYNHLRTDEVRTQYPKSATLGASITRPHSSPQETSAPLPRRPHTSTDFFRHPDLFPPVPPSNRSTVHDDQKRIGMVFCNGSTEEVLLTHEMGASTTPSTLTNRSTTSALHESLIKSGPSSGSTPASRTGSALSIPHLVGHRDGSATFQFEQLQEADAEVMLISQISELRASHEAHLNSLKETHEKEIAGHRSYIAFLEKRRATAMTTGTTESAQALRIDTSHDNTEASTDASANTLKSFESSLDSQKQTSSEAPTEVELLKRKLSLWRKAQVDSVEVRRERDRFREASERGDKRVVQLKDIVRKAKDNEKSLKNAVADLEARLVAANNERTDVLEGYHTACEQVRALSLREEILCQELDDARSHLFYSSSQPIAEGQPAPASSGFATASQLGHDPRVQQQDDALLKQLQDLRRLVLQKDTRINELEHGTSRTTEGFIDHAHSPSQAERISKLELELDIQKQMVASANSLLHDEIRRQARFAASKPLPVTPSIEAEASIITTERMAQLKAQTSPSSFLLDAGVDVPQGQMIAALEKELEHYVKEIVMYKLDVKGYKKDLKRANARLEILQPAGHADSSTADQGTVPSVDSHTSPEAQRRPRSDSAHHPAYTPDSKQSGLGISISGPFETPRKSLSSATSAALLSSTTPPPTSSTISSPPSIRPRTPLSAHKKLPKPPPSPRMLPIPAVEPSIKSNVQRTETQRSLSESIISSYAKRTTPEQDHDGSPRTRERSSDPPRSRGSPLPPPLSRFASSRTQIQGPTSTNGTKAQSEE